MTWLKVLVALVAVVVLWRLGLGALRAFARPVEPPPEPGELRKVNLRYRCVVCATEVRMTLAADELPEPPRHCREDMDLVAPVE
jgi:hypothetical protein